MLIPVQSYQVDVDFTNRDIADGAFVVSTRRVTVAADNDTQATLVAAQLVAAIRDNLDGMVTATRLVV